jgi:hypothetical protein
MNKLGRRLFSRDKFKLDHAREVFIDGHPYVIVGYSSSGPYSDRPKILIEFEPLERYLANSSVHSQGPWL